MSISLTNTPLEQILSCEAFLSQREMNYSGLEYESHEMEAISDCLENFRPGDLIHLTLQPEEGRILKLDYDWFATSDYKVGDRVTLDPKKESCWKSHSFLGRLKFSQQFEVVKIEVIKDLRTRFLKY